MLSAGFQTSVQLGRFSSAYKRRSRFPSFASSRVPFATQKASGATLRVHYPSRKRKAMVAKADRGEHDEQADVGRAPASARAAPAVRPVLLLLLHARMADRGHEASRAMSC